MLPRRLGQAQLAASSPGGRFRTRMRAAGWSPPPSACGNPTCAWSRPAMGGTFGYKMSGHTEEALVGLLSRLLGRPVAYVEDRRDSFLGHCREQRPSLRDRGRRGGPHRRLPRRLLADVGTVSPGNGWTMPLVTATVFPTVYDVPNVEVSCTLVATQQGAVAAGARLRQGGGEPRDGTRRGPSGGPSAHGQGRAARAQPAARRRPCPAACPPASTSTAATTRRR